jgi:hypothetical protein
MKSIDYVPSPADSCLFINTSTNKSFVVIYVDDGGIFSTKENIETLIKALSKDFCMDSSTKTSKASYRELLQPNCHSQELQNHSWTQNINFTPQARRSSYIC